MCGSNLILYRCVLIADWLRRETVGEWWVRAGSGRAGRAVEMKNKISTFGFKLQFFSADFYKGRGRLRGKNFFRSSGAGRAPGGVMDGGGSVCPFVCVSRKVIRPSF